ncbi:glycosyltransferase family 4 protein [Turicibacter bilis]|uniref:glycosyltransferase family 4 protein n=1 Tax=Turicibacter bilis TaxID=2735723 RepID=UPI0031BA2B82
MRKVLYVTTVSQTVNSFLVPHIEMLLDEGYQVDIATHIDKPIDASLIKRDVNIYNIPFSRNPLSLGNLKAFSKLLTIQKEKRYEVVHVHTPVASVFGRLLKLSYPNLKTIYTAHGYHFLKDGPKTGWFLYYPIEKMMAKFTDIIITINQEDYDITVNKLKPRKAYLMNGVGLDLSHYKQLSEEQITKTRQELGLSEDDFVIIMIAELNENKNHIQLIRAMKQLKDCYPNIHAICVGEGDKLNELEEEVKSNRLDRRIQFLGYRSDITELINISNIGILLSHREGLPRNLMELMACGRRVIGTNIRGCRDIILNSYIGEIVEVNDINQTCRAIEKLYHSSEDKDKVVKEAMKYDINRVVAQLKAIYDELEGEFYES